MHPISPKSSILVVDDTAENLRLLSGVLGTAGYEVRIASSGKQALKAVEHVAPDLVLLDIDMPEMDGYEVCRRLQRNHAAHSLPVIFLTAFTDTSQKVKAFDVGAVDYITKPFQVDEVLARVKTHLDLRRTRQELKGALSRLQELEALRDSLVQMVVHDMRSPLMLLKLHLSMLLPQVPTGSEQVREAMQAADRVQRMTHDLLDVSRLSEGKLPLHPETCRLEELAQHVVQELALLEPKRQLLVSAPAAAPAYADPAVVTRVIENLVLNAIKHTPAHSRIWVTVTTTANESQIVVEDEGPGIPEGARAQIFDKYVSAASRRSSPYHSSGLGLTFCKLAVEASAGSIGVESAESGGSRFFVRFPSARRP